MMGRREAPLQKACEALARKGVRCSYKTGDVRREADAGAVVAHTIAEYGVLDILVNCAAGNFLAPAETLSPKGFATVMVS
jgi:peroxisomal 2,4-dienoyl-CoA reductase